MEEQYFIDFTEYLDPLFDLDDDWHHLYTDGSIDVIEDNGDAVLRHTTGSGNEDIFFWEDIEGATDVEIALLVEFSASGDDMRIALRGGNALQSKQGYHLVFRTWSDPELVLTRYDNGDSTEMNATSTHDPSSGELWWMRMRVEEDVVYGKAWEQGTSEPSWDFQETDNSYWDGSHGFASQLFSEGDTIDIHSFGIGTNGAEAPTADIDPDVRGTLTLPDDSPASGAVVKAVNRETNEVKKVTANSEGEYEIYNLRSGKWDILFAYGDEYHVARPELGVDI